MSVAGRISVLGVLLLVSGAALAAYGSLRPCTAPEPFIMQQCTDRTAEELRAARAQREWIVLADEAKWPFAAMAFMALVFGAWRGVIGRKFALALTAVPFVGLAIWAVDRFVLVGALGRDAAFFFFTRDYHSGVPVLASQALLLSLALVLAGWVTQAWRYARNRRAIVSPRQR